MAKKLNTNWLLTAIVVACAMCTGVATFAKSPPKKPSSAAIENLRQSAKKAINNGDYETALHLYRKLAETGDARGQYEAGVMVQGDHPKEALKWWRLAAAQGYAKAEYKLGTAYEHGYGVPKDRKAAIKWYKLAATHGLLKAQYRLGIKKPPNDLPSSVVAAKPSKTTPSFDEYYTMNDPDHVVTGKWALLCVFPGQLKEATQAAIANDEAWLKKLGCIEARGGIPVIVIERFSDVWEVHVSGSNGGLTVYGEYYDFKSKDGRRLNEQGFVEKKKCAAGKC